MDIEEDVEIPLILGRPFMLTSNCVVDMGKGNLQMGIDDKKITFDLFDEKSTHLTKMFVPRWMKLRMRWF